MLAFANTKILVTELVGTYDHVSFLQDFHSFRNGAHFDESKVWWLMVKTDRCQAFRVSSVSASQFFCATNNHVPHSPLCTVALK